MKSAVARGSSNQISQDDPPTERRRSRRVRFAPSPDVDPGSLSDLRLASLCDADREGIDVEMLAAYDHCLQKLVVLGASVRPVALGQALNRSGEPTPMAAEAFALYGEVARDPHSRMDSAVRARVLAGNVPASVYLQQRAAVTAQSVDYHERMAGFDAFVVPTTQVPAVPLDTIGSRNNATVLTRFMNLFGLCGVALPSGYNTDGLPLSLQIACPAYHEHVAMRVAAALEAVMAEQRHYPQL